MNAVLDKTVGIECKSVNIFKRLESKFKIQGLLNRCAMRVVFGANVCLKLNPKYRETFDMGLPSADF